MDIEQTAPAGKGLAAPARVGQLRDALGRSYEPAVSPRLKILLFFTFACVALLGATGVYLVAIRVMEWAKHITYTNQFTLWMFLVHVVVGVVLVVPFLVFGFSHYATARHRKNRWAVKLGLTLFVTGIIVGVSGLALIQLEGLPQMPTGTLSRSVIYFLHILAPIAAVTLYILHRRAGPDIQWRWGYVWGGAVGAFVVVMIFMHSYDPRTWYAKGSPEGERYFEPSKARTKDGKFIAENVLMMDQYCLKCHADAYNGWFHSAHHFSSFNNPPYKFSVDETREVSLKRDGEVRASRWCAGCHDPVPFFSGQFDNKNFNEVDHPTAHAGITCTVCHAITNINSTAGNADYTIEEPLHYPFAYSDNPVLQWINNQLVKAKPDFHKKTFLKDFHRSAEFCSTCHKVSLPFPLNHYKEFLRGQDHYGPYLLSGVSGHGARSWYYPAEAKTRCAECHMPLSPSGDFGARDFDASGQRKIHNHLFPGANTGLPWLLSLDPKHADRAEAFRRAARAQADFLKGTDPNGVDKKMRIDIFGLKPDGTINGKLIAPLRPELPALQPGQTYLVEVVIRTLGMGHLFTQGTADSNEVWVDFMARSGDRIIGRSGALDGGDRGRVDEWSHFVNVLMLDREGNRINRRNPQDIFTPLYNHQIPPGAAQVVHYSLTVPKDVSGPVELTVKLRYRKFDFEYMALVYKGEDKVPALPIIDLCEDRVILPVEGLAAKVPVQTSPIQPAWQRWNDYGIGCFLEGGPDGKKGGELRQAEEAFKHLCDSSDKPAHGHGYLNLARVYNSQGLLEQAREALTKARQADPPAPWWTVAWFTGLVNAQNGRLDEAIANFEQILDPKNQLSERKFDFGLDYVVINELGRYLFVRSEQEHENPAERDRFLRRAAEQFEKTLSIEPEDMEAHFGLGQCYLRLGQNAAQLLKPNDKPLGDLAEQIKMIADPKQPKESRVQNALRFAGAVMAYGDKPPDPKEPKLLVLQKLIDQCLSAFRQENDPEISAAIALGLGQLHFQAHAIIKPDDNAADRTIALYRQKHPAAARASQPIVIYPLHRPDAPGLKEANKGAPPPELSKSGG
jgi:tetratricopeptide (TPR) repeat protein